MSADGVPGEGSSEKVRRPWIILSVLRTWPVRLLAFLAAGGLALLLFAIGRESPGVEGAFSFSFILMLFGSLACTRLARRLLHFGIEIRPFVSIRAEALWALAARVYGLDLLLVLVLAPALGFVIGSGWQDSLLVSINIFALHLLFLAVSACAILAPGTTLPARAVYSSLFPYTAIPNVGMSAIYLGLFIIYILGKNDILDDFLEPALRWLAVYLLELPVLGPMILFLANPYFLIIALHLDPRFPAAASVAFAVICAIVTFAFVTRIRRVLAIDVDELDERVYDGWLIARQQSQWQQHEAEDDEMEQWLQQRAAVDSVEQGGIEPEELEPGVDCDEELGEFEDTDQLPPVNVYQLPETTAEMLQVAEQALPLRVMVTRRGIAAVALFVVVSFWFKPLAAIGYLVWIAATAFLVYPAIPGSLILPLRAWPVILWSIRNRVLPCFLVDAVLIALIVAITSVVWQSYPMILFCSLVLRIHALGFKIVFMQQNKGVFIWMLFPVAAFFIWSLSRVGYELDLSLPKQAVTVAGVVATLLLNGLLVAWSLLRRYDCLIHYEKERSSSQL